MEIDIVNIEPANDGKPSLPGDEAKELASLEQLVAQGKEMFLLVGNALSRIRDKRLYRAEFGTFEDYLWIRWEISRGHGWRLIQASELASRLKEMSPEGDICLPTSHRACRALMAFPKVEDQLAILRKAAERMENGAITTRMLNEAAGELNLIPKKPATEHHDNPFSSPQRILDQIESAVVGGLPRTETVRLIAELREALAKRNYLRAVHGGNPSQSSNLYEPNKNRQFKGKQRKRRKKKQMKNEAMNDLTDTATVKSRHIQNNNDAMKGGN